MNGSVVCRASVGPVSPRLRIRPRCVCELLALSLDVGLGASKSVCLRVIPDFVAGSVQTGVAPRLYAIPALDFLVGVGPVGSLLGPVRVLQWFNVLSAGSRPDIQMLSVLLRPLPWLRWLLSSVYVFLDSFR